MTPERLRTWVVPAAVALLAGGLALMIAIATGTFDPRPVGPLFNETGFSPLHLAAGKEALFWEMSRAGPRAAHSWRLSAALTAGELDSGYGLAIGDEARALVVAVSPLGYVAIWERDAAGEMTAEWLPWQPWPHVRTGEAVNEIWLDIVPDGDVDRLIVRVNRELLWQGAVAVLGSEVGRWAASYGDEATVAFPRLQRFDAESRVNATK